MQLYSTYLGYSRKIIFNSKSESIDICYLEDGFNNNSFPLKKLTNIAKWNNEGIYVKYRNKILRDLSKGSIIHWFYYRYYLKISNHR
jgi:hypothetical protein